MLLEIAVILIILWALGFGFAITTSALIHGLLFVALILCIVRLLQGRKII